MKFDDDYLWDGTGEPDADVERLESLLGRYRSTSEAPKLPAAPAAPAAAARSVRRPLLWLAAAAAAVLVFGAAFAVFMRTGGQVAPSGNEVVQAPGEAAPRPATNEPLGATNPDPHTPPIAKAGTPKASPSPKRRVAPLAVPTPETSTPGAAVALATDRGPTDRGPTDRGPTDRGPTEEPTRMPRPRQAIEVYTALHVEQAELLLRSVRNADVRGGDAAELAVDAARSRELLEQNVVLRRAAATRRNLPVERLLGTLEPYLLDIANLGPSPSTDDVRSIQERIERKEIVSDLQIYALMSPGRGL